MKIIKNTSCIYKFEFGLKPIATVKPGEIFQIITNDCFDQQVKTNEDIVSDIDFGRVNPATGPIFIEGAEIGDTLKVEIIDIEINDHGSIVVLPGAGVLGEQVTQPLTRIVSIEDDYVNFLGIKAPIDPMIGVIGVSPGKDQEGVVTGTPFNHGGNMDTTDIRKNTTLYFPVRETGAMFALGDVHAIMGDGELCVSGLEVEAKVTVKASLIKNKQLNWPLLENETEYMIIGSGETMEKAIEVTATEMTQLVAETHQILWEEAYMYSSLFVDYRISQAVNPMKTVRAAVKKDLLPLKW